MNRIGPVVRQLREAQQLTQEQLVARCNLVGWDISRGTLAKVEAKVRRITDYEVVWLAMALRVPVNRLFEVANLPTSPYIDGQTTKTKSLV